jgi:hypothetical protein
MNHHDKDRISAKFINMCHFCIFLRRYLSYICGRITLTFLRREMLDKIGKPHEVCNPKKRPLLPHDGLGIRGNSIGPLRRNRANPAVIDAQQEPLAGPIIALADPDELPTGEWMEGMGYAHKLCHSDGNVCILR